MYDFDEIVDRRGSGSLKWDVADDELPMWVADMDFKTCPDIIEAILERTRHGIFGYSIIPDEWNSAYVSWWKERHNYEINPESLIFCTGVVPAISSCVRKLTAPGENVVILTPVYNIFFNSIFNNGVNVLQCPLKYENYEYSIDFGRFEEAVADPQTTLLIFCNPHNPCGKIWDRQTLAKVGSLCKKYNVNIISDEIHCDITQPQKEYVPFASVSEECADISITCIAPTKCFNMAGLQTAAVMVPNRNLRHKVWRALNTDEVAEPNAFAITAAVAAFTKGQHWLDELCKYLWDNRQYAEQFIKNEIPKLKVIKADATYLMWVDCGRITDDSVEFTEFIRRKTGLYISDGAEYGDAGRKFVRINLACQKKRLEDGMNRLKNAVNAYETEV
nr:MalY/PatB family protein [uncultured Agathobacter sp.]